VNPRQKALKVFEAQAIATRKMEDPISPIEAAIWQARVDALQEMADHCLAIQMPGLSQSAQDYNAGCEDCARAAIERKGRITF